MVDPLGTRLVSALTGKVAPVSRTTAVAATKATAGDGDSAVSELSAVSAQMAASAPVDVDKVAEIKKAIADGTYPIHPETVADRLLALKLNWRPDDAA